MGVVCPSEEAGQVNEPLDEKNLSKPTIHPDVITAKDSEKTSQLNSKEANDTVGSLNPA